MSDEKSEAQKDRQTRLNEALRANLRKRKQQTQARKAPNKDTDRTADSLKKDV